MMAKEPEIVCAVCKKTTCECAWKSKDTLPVLVWKSRDALPILTKSPLEVTFHNFELPSNEHYISDIIDRYRYLFPSWLRMLSMSVYDEKEDMPESTVAWNTARPEYGEASINIFSRWFDRPERDQRAFILHEILHIAHRREYNFVWDRLLNPMAKNNEELHGFLVEDYRERNEEFIEGLVRAIVNGEDGILIRKTSAIGPTTSFPESVFVPGLDPEKNRVNEETEAGLFKPWEKDSMSSYTEHYKTRNKMGD